MERLPRTIHDGLSQWQIEINQPDHFRAVRRFSPATASTDLKALALLFFGTGSLFAAGAALQLVDALRRIVRYRHPIAWREGAIFLGIVLGWALIVYLFWPRRKVLEARPGFLRFGRQSWSSGQVARLQIRRVRRDNVSPLSQFEYVPWGNNTMYSTQVSVVQKDGRIRLVWVHSGKHYTRAATWARHMARVAGVPTAGRNKGTARPV